MITSIWAAGILFTITVFAVKVGLGLGFYPVSRKKIGRVLVLYLGIFLLMGLVLEWTAMPRYFIFFQKFMKLGTTLHVLIAVGMLGWGYFLISRPEPADPGHCGTCEQDASPLWLVILPCPVCLTAILLSTSVALSFLPYPGWLVGGVLGLVFCLLTLLTVILSRYGLKKSVTAPIHRLGLLMTSIGAYFLLSLLLAPVVTQAKEIYQGAIPQKSSASPYQTGLFALFIALLIAAGFFKQRRGAK